MFVFHFVFLSNWGDGRDLNSQVLFRHQIHSLACLANSITAAMSLFCRIFRGFNASHTSISCATSITSFKQFPLAHRPTLQSPLSQTPHYFRQTSCTIFFILFLSYIRLPVSQSETKSCTFFSQLLQFKIHFFIYVFHNSLS